MVKRNVNLKKASDPFVIDDPTLGSDPEVFIFSEAENRIVSSIGLVGGSKWEPKPVGDSLGFFVQEDNVLAEFNIPPTSTKHDFVTAINLGLEYLTKVLPPNHKPFVKASHNFEMSQLESDAAKAFGCEPDMNAWTGKINPPPNSKIDPSLRSGGGHVVVGYKKPNHECNRQLIKYMDALLGVPSVLLDRDAKRRVLYGKAGAYRNKAYGVEYRTLSSFWIEKSNLTGWVFDQTMEAIKCVNANNDELLEHDTMIVNIINNNDHDLAELFVDEYKINMP